MVHCMREYLHADNHMAYHLWVLMFPIVWATLEKQQQVGGREGGAPRGCCLCLHDPAASQPFGRQQPVERLHARGPHGPQAAQAPSRAHPRVRPPSLPARTQVTLAKPIIQLLSKEYHYKQSHLRPNVIQVGGGGA